MMRRALSWTAGCLFAASVALSAIHPWGNPHTGVQSGAPVLQGAEIPEEVRSTLAAKCGDCHSENTRYPPYSHLAPFSWMIDHDVHLGRENVNLSKWQLYRPDEQINALTRIASEVHTGQMPPAVYAFVHPGSQLSLDEQISIYDWAKAERKRLRSQQAQLTKSSPVASKKE
jgi:hypothetical protein